MSFGIRSSLRNIIGPTSLPSRTLWNFNDLVNLVQFIFFRDSLKPHFIGSLNSLLDIDTVNVIVTNTRQKNFLENKTARLVTAKYSENVYT